jgi:FixJ family two-component response regulator
MSARSVSRDLTQADQAVVYVVDDDISVRESLETLIRWAGWSAQTFASAEEFLWHPRLAAPSCLILDVGLPELSGLELQARVVANHGDIPIIFITAYGDVPTTVRAMRAGALEFLTKPFDDEDLLAAIRHAIVRSQIAFQDEAELRQLRERYGSLTQRERQVMTLVVSGMLNKQIGIQLGTSDITVKAHRGKVMRKMLADSLADLVRMATRLNLPLVTRY